MDFWSIRSQIRIAKLYSFDLLDQIDTGRQQGDDVCCLELRSIILQVWIEILERYLNTHYDENAEVIDDPIDTTFTADQIAELIAKVKTMVGSNKYPLPAGVIDDSGYFSDPSYWSETAEWRDGSLW